MPARLRNGGSVGGTLDRIAAAYGGVILLLGRLTLAAIFVPSGYGKFTRLDPFAQSLAARACPHRGCWQSLPRASSFSVGTAWRWD